MLTSEQGENIFLFHFIEVIEELLDYDTIKKEFPMLSYKQINGAISFLHKLAQINASNLDIDEIEDKSDAMDSELISQLHIAVNNREKVINIIDIN